MSKFIEIIKLFYIYAFAQSPRKMDTGYKVHSYREKALIV
jgi:hypothetical protein